MKTIKKLLVANRGEIAIRIFRAANELGITTVGVYSYEDRLNLHRFKADETYCIGEAGEPIKNYLNIVEIIKIAKLSGADAIHPGYGFLSENVEFARACREAGILFIGPSNEVLDALGDKVKAKEIAIRENIPVLGTNNEPINSVEKAQEIAASIGYPVILKAAHGGGGRGMRVVNIEADLKQSFESARSESINAFGSDKIFIEKFISSAKHIEVQLLGDLKGNLVHLYERDCSLQRRHQKVIEIAPSPKLDPKLRDEICAAAIKIGKSVGYSNAGTVEFLVDDKANEFFFIEVNPRIQVEHTITEEVTNIDIVKSQILIEQGFALSDPSIGINSQQDIETTGFAMQCRITTEDASNNFTPDYGKITYYNSTGGAGVRLDAGSAYTGAVVNPYFDSMLVKVTVRGTSFEATRLRMMRALKEFRIRGVKSNIQFLKHLIENPTFIKAEATTRFIDNTPELFNFKEQQDRAQKTLSYLANTIVNGNDLVKGRKFTTNRSPITVPNFVFQDEPQGLRNKFKKIGAKKFADWVLDQKELLVTDTTMRDAHQSLLATRMRTHDMLNIAPYYSHKANQFFSLEMWGGATFDTSMRFLHESPWERLELMRKAIPNVLFQMLIRASSAVGYANYPDNVVKSFVRQSAASGIDVFRVFDALNWMDNMRFAMDCVLEEDAICEAAICYTGDILNPSRSKYDLKYYVNMAKEIEKAGAHILAIKDMAGLCKPHSAALLVSTLKQEIGIPIHFHTHDTSGLSAASVIAAADAGADIVDAALASFSGGTSQPNMNTILESVRFSERKAKLDATDLDQLSEYWRLVREYYSAFESETLPANADLYRHEMPGGQYTNLLEQARALGLSDKWTDVCSTYANVNQLFGDIVKVTPSSKAVGDMALFMVANDLSTADILDKSRHHAYPSSVIDLISGRMGQPYQGFPQEVKDVILHNVKELKGRAGELLEPVDFAKIEQHLTDMKVEVNPQNCLSYILYPKVFEDYCKHQALYGEDTGAIPTYAFFYGMEIDEEIRIALKDRKEMIIKYVAQSQANKKGERTVFFEINGIPREVVIRDLSASADDSTMEKADENNLSHIAAFMPGMISKLNVNVGDKVDKGDTLLTIEAMKMENTLNAQYQGVVTKILVKSGTQIDTGDLLLIIEPEH